LITLIFKPKTKTESTAQNPGEFLTFLKKDGEPDETILHGVTLLATGGSQAPLKAATDNPQQKELTQKEFEVGFKTIKLILKNWKL